jgi:GNAT superfamily N-acetyltransferase
MRFRVEPSPAGGWYVKLAGHDAPVSRHDTEEEALARAQAYERGAAIEGERVTLRDGSRSVVRPVVPEDRPRFVESWERFGEESRKRRFMGVKKRLSPEELTFFTEFDHEDHEAIGALDAETGDGVGVARYIRVPDRRGVAEAAVSVIDAWQGRGLGGVLLERLARRARDQGIRRFSAKLMADNGRCCASSSASARRRSTAATATSSSTSSYRSTTPSASARRCAPPRLGTSLHGRRRPFARASRARADRPFSPRPTGRSGPRVRERRVGGLTPLPGRPGATG